MTLRTLIPLVLLGALATYANALGQDVSQWGDLSGQFLWEGELPALKNIQVTTCPSIGSEIENETLIVNAKNRGIANIAVYLAPSTTSVLNVHPMYDRTADAKVELQMKHGRFLPRILLMRTSQVMNQVNKDSIGHNAKIDFFDNSPG